MYGYKYQEYIYNVEQVFKQIIGASAPSYRNGVDEKYWYRHSLVDMYIEQFVYTYILEPFKA